jgi:hypothetical protein
MLVIKILNVVHVVEWVMVASAELVVTEAVSWLYRQKHP